MQKIIMKSAAPLAAEYLQGTDAKILGLCDFFLSEKTEQERQKYATYLQCWVDEILDPENPAISVENYCKIFVAQDKKNYLQFGKELKSETGEVIDFLPINQIAGDEVIRLLINFIKINAND